MKKIMMMILIVSMVMMGLSAVVLDSAVLNLTAVVEEVNEVGVFDSLVTSTEAFASSSKNVSKVLPNIDPTDIDTKKLNTLYLAVRTNRADALTIEVTISELVNGTNSMLYNVDFATAHGNTGEVVEAGNTHTLTVPANTGLTLYNFPFQIGITKEQYQVATPDSYSATVTFEYTSL